MYTDAPFPALHLLLPHLLKYWKGEPKQLDHLSTEEEDALLTLRQTLFATPLRELLPGQGCLTLETGTCDKQTGFRLMQGQPDAAKVPEARLFDVRLPVC